MGSTGMAITRCMVTTSRGRMGRIAVARGYRTRSPRRAPRQDLAYDTLSTRSYVDQTAKSVALGVVQNYQGSDGSGLATKSDITAAKASITSTVASTYATKTGVTQEISSKITQNNNSLDVKFSTKVETQNAQNKANTRRLARDQRAIPRRKP